MFVDWLHWQSSLSWLDLELLLLGTLLVDAPRYTLARIAMFVYDYCRETWRALRGVNEQVEFDYCPSVCVILAGYNEADSVGWSIESLVGKYPRLEIIVIDDGSADRRNRNRARHVCAEGRGGSGGT